MDLPLRVHLFGRFRFERGSEAIRLSTRKVELLLAYLVLNPGFHSRERTAALLWGDSSDQSARASLRNALAILRREVDPDLLATDRQSVALRADFPLWVDALQFRSEARRFLDSPSSDHSRVPLDLYTDDLLVDFYEDWVLVERRGFRELYLDALLELTQQLRSHTEYEDARRFATLALHHDRANERAHQHLMFCHLAVGNRAAALRQFESCRAAMEEELGVEPSDA
ncbi:MAG TPA: BTAD domain-containing putative transcriptional regulator, partial [Acidimicrobiia bacterium]